MRYRLQFYQSASSTWADIEVGYDLGMLAGLMGARDAHDRVARRIVEGRDIIMRGRWCDQSNAATIKHFWIVMSLDKPGPCERTGKPYRQHLSAEDAIGEARRLSTACDGGRFGILGLQRVVGWIDQEITAPADKDDGIPF